MTLVTCCLTFDLSNIPSINQTHCTPSCPARGRRGCRSGRRCEPGSWCVLLWSSCRCVRSSAAACRSSTGDSRTPSAPPAAGCWSRRSRCDWLLKRESGGGENKNKVVGQKNFRNQGDKTGEKPRGEAGGRQGGGGGEAGGSGTATHRGQKTSTAQH